jgi:hypothetical protein
VTARDAKARKTDPASERGRVASPEADRSFPPTRPEDVFGMLRRDGPPITLEQMDAAISAEARRRSDRR